MRLFVRILPCYPLPLILVIVYLIQNVPTACPLCSNCRSGKGQNCRDGYCSTSNCDIEPRWYLNSSAGVITDGPGNYSTNMRCTWLIDARQPNSSGRPRIRFRVDQFATECGWDHLYIWDGDSTSDPMLASFSGLLRDDEVKAEVTARSGTAYVHFYSDVAVTMAGFNMSYEISGCEKGCSFAHGKCVSKANGSLVCVCEKGWTGDDCSQPSGCPSTFSCQNDGKCVDSACHCTDGFKGIDCSLSAAEGFWEKVDFSETESLPLRSASHATVLVRDQNQQDVYWIGGETFGYEKDLRNIHKLDMASMKFDVVESTSGTNPARRFGHSVVSYNDSIYMFGGLVNGSVVVNELWQWEPRHEVWILRNFVNECRLGCYPLPTSGHTAHVIGNKMLVFFGFGGNDYGYLNTVQELNFGASSQHKWSVVQTQGVHVFGTYGHSSVHDPISNLVFLYGGFFQFRYHDIIGDSGESFWNRVITYDPAKAMFKQLRFAPVPRFLHTGVLLDRMILFFGGNPHNETYASRSMACYISDFMAYDIECDEWHVMKAPQIPYSSVRFARYGHSALLFKEQMYLFGGYQGVLSNEVLKFTPGQCRYFKTREECLLGLKMGRKCAWNERQKLCKEASNMLPGFEYGKCISSRTPELDNSFCDKEFHSCGNCLSSSVKCHWCKGGQRCSMLPCRDEEAPVTELGSCPKEPERLCEVYINCFACYSLSNDTCIWKKDDIRSGKCVPKPPGPPTDVAEAVGTCEMSCSDRSTCETCTTPMGPCIWCASDEKCIEPSSYLAVYGYGQCRDWHSSQKRCPRSPKCTGFKSCKQCLENPDCGWCDDGSSTGMGQCSVGSSRGPKELGTCPVPRWYFVTCPSCSCNGHARCVNGTNFCERCDDFTEGAHCEKCKADWFGDPRNGGNCTECQCPVSSHGCDPDSGNCKCSTKGTTGRQCDKCDESNHYVGHNGQCFYELPVGYQFTFNLTKVEDTHFTGINFKSSPPEKDFDVKFTLVCTNDSYVNVSFRTAVMFHEEFLITNTVCNLEHKIDRIFSHDQLPFGQDGLNTTVFVYVHDFVTPSVIVISFAQHASLDLLHFFVVFACCFLSLLLLAAILWKVKQKYDIYRRRQRMFVEMEQMAKRPFATVQLEVTRNHDNNFEKTIPGVVPVRKRNARTLPRPTFIATEPLADGKHAVMSALICLPSGGGGGEGQFTPAGQTGLIIGSTLVLYGSHSRKPSVDANKDKLKAHKNTAESET